MPSSKVKTPAKRLQPNEKGVFISLSDRVYLYSFMQSFSFGRRRSRRLLCSLSLHEKRERGNGICFQCWMPPPAGSGILSGANRTRVRKSHHRISGAYVAMQTPQSPRDVAINHVDEADEGTFFHR